MNIIGLIVVIVSITIFTFWIGFRKPHKHLPETYAELVAQLEAESKARDTSFRSIGAAAVEKARERTLEASGKPKSRS